MSGEALELLTRIAKETSLRYAMHMIMTAALCCKQRKGAEVEVQDIRRVYSLFSDLRRSTQYLIEFNKSFMFNEIENPEEDEGEGEGKEGAGTGAGAGAGAGAAHASNPAPVAPVSGAGAPMDTA